LPPPVITTTSAASAIKIIPPLMSRGAFAHQDLVDFFLFISFKFLKMEEGPPAEQIEIGKPLILVFGELLSAKYCDGSVKGCKACVKCGDIVQGYYKLRIYRKDEKLIMCQDCYP
jgi:hypothetical protein